MYHLMVMQKTLIFLDGSQDLFDNFKNIMPGEVRTQNIVFKKMMIIES